MRKRSGTGNKGQVKYRGSGPEAPSGDPGSNWRADTFPPHAHSGRKTGNRCSTCPLIPAQNIPDGYLLDFSRPKKLVLFALIGSTKSGRREEVAGHDFTSWEMGSDDKTLHDEILVLGTSARRGAIWNSVGGSPPGPRCKAHPRLPLQGARVLTYSLSIR